VQAADAPIPPCAGPAHPTASAAGDALQQVIWLKDELPAGWSLPACTGWEADTGKGILAAAGRLELPDGIEPLVTRLVAYSRHTDIIYWSASRGKWRPQFRESWALSGPDPEMLRDDFTANEVNSGSVIHFWQREDNPTRGVIYELRVRERTPDRLEFEIINVTPLRFLFPAFLIARPGMLRQYYFLDREDDSTWQYYTLVQMGRDSEISGKNYRNRVAALFRYLGGLPMDRDPPAAR
jgi:hypothetical protein